MNSFFEETSAIFDKGTDLTISQKKSKLFSYNDRADYTCMVVQNSEGRWNGYDDALIMHEIAENKYDLRYASARWHNRLKGLYILIHNSLEISTS